MNMLFAKNHRAELHERLRVCVYIQHSTVVCMQDTALVSTYEKVTELVN